MEVAAAEESLQGQRQYDDQPVGEETVGAVVTLECLEESRKNEEVVKCELACSRRCLLLFSVAIARGDSFVADQGAWNRAHPYRSTLTLHSVKTRLDSQGS